MSFVTGKEVVTGRAQWWNSDLKPHVDATRSSPVGGVEAANSGRVAGECNRILGQELSAKEEKMHADVVMETRVKKLDAWETCRVS